MHCHGGFLGIGREKKCHTYHTPVAICKFLGFIPIPPTLDNLSVDNIIIQQGKLYKMGRKTHSPQPIS